MSKMMVMSGGEMMKNDDLEDIIESHGLKVPPKRPIRDLANHLDDNLNPLPPPQSLPPGVQPPEDIPEGFDLSTVEAQEDGQFCVFKKLTLEGIEKIPVQQCVHKVDKQCYFSYVTQYTPTTEDECSENFKKKCYIEYIKTSVTETLEKCFHPMERICSPPKYGEIPNEVCQTQYETSCVTRYKDTPVVENVEECVKVYKKVCQDVPSEGYGVEPTQVCSKKPVEDCRTVAKTVYKKLPDTTCERLPFEACAPDNCVFVPGAAQCHNKTVDIGIDKPEEVCDLQPQRMCKQVYRLVPKLYPKEICEEVPREVCYTTLKNPRKVSTPLLTKWCFKPEPIEKPQPSYHPAPVYPPQAPVYPPPAPVYPPPAPVYKPLPSYPPPPHVFKPSYPPVYPGPSSHPPPPLKYGFKIVGGQPAPPPYLPAQPVSKLVPDFPFNQLNEFPSEPEIPSSSNSL